MLCLSPMQSQQSGPLISPVLPQQVSSMTPVPQVGVLLDHANFQTTSEAGSNAGPTAQAPAPNIFENC
jgi:hypothetical protein